MRTDKLNAKITGIFFIVAATSAIVGLALYSPLLTNPNYLTDGIKNSNQIVFGAICELILACTATGTGIMLFSHLKKHNSTLAIGYLSFRLLEVVFILIGIVSVLGMLSLSQHYTSNPSPQIATFHILGQVLKAMHDWTFMLGPNFMLGVNTFIYSLAFYKYQTIPTKLAIFGMTASIMILIAAVLELFGIILQLSTWGALLAIPIFLYEMNIAVWFIVKGYL